MQYVEVVLPGYRLWFSNSGCVLLFVMLYIPCIILWFIQQPKDARNRIQVTTYVNLVHVSRHWSAIRRDHGLFLITGIQGQYANIGSISSPLK
jgi:hypothetical protein